MNLVEINVNFFVVRIYGKSVSHKIPHFFATNFLDYSNMSRRKMFSEFLREVYFDVIIFAIFNFLKNFITIPP